MAKITETEFARICEDLHKDRAKIIEHNPVGTPEEIMLWMLLSILISYLSLSDLETPCFSGRPTAETYRQAIFFVLEDRRTENFDVEKYLDIFRQ